MYAVLCSIRKYQNNYKVLENIFLWCCRTVEEICQPVFMRHFPLHLTPRMRSWSSHRSQSVSTLCIYLYGCDDHYTTETMSGSYNRWKLFNQRCFNSVIFSFINLSSSNLLNCNDFAAAEYPVMKLVSFIISICLNKQSVIGQPVLSDTFQGCWWII